MKKKRSPGFWCKMCKRKTLIKFSCGCTYCTWQGTPLETCKKHQV